ncbi:5-formyltetrahydrofolate cyclo-ligase [Corynebacterium hansenii]|uniref:5-formyltetrahydrofolate cyclo-ligase n=1 Tax=Corynebacterium hansenii TaxID=394964 RepID=A0ABV7ZQ13_9CORY|nr:5-formyltetrahydrofolate cyclo-ligase [Corynebacterium hansenii]WJZ00809.1 5-formyltetrahydrofolate cyclo-ligase family protein [Corynebacterium hansenii]
MGNGLDGGHGGAGGAAAGPAAGGSAGASAKGALRRSLLGARSASAPERMAADDARLAERVVEWIASNRDAGDSPLTIAAHVPVDAEPGATSLAPDQLLDALAEVDGMPPVRLLLPVCPPGPPAALQWAEYARGPWRGSLEPGKYGLLEPAGPRLGPTAIADAGIVLVPGVAADRSGMRMGRGAGYYDRSLAHATGRLAVILHPNEVVEAVPHDAHDLPVDAIITAEELILPGA